MHWWVKQSWVMGQGLYVWKNGSERKRQVELRRRKLLARPWQVSLFLAGNYSVRVPFSSLLELFSLLLLQLFTPSFGHLFLWLARRSSTSFHIFLASSLDLIRSWTLFRNSHHSLLRRQVWIKERRKYLSPSSMTVPSPRMAATTENPEEIHK